MKDLKQFNPTSIHFEKLSELSTVTAIMFWGILAIAIAFVCCCCYFLCPACCTSICTCCCNQLCNCLPSQRTIRTYQNHRRLRNRNPPPVQLSLISDEHENSIFEAPPPDYHNVANSATTSRNSQIFKAPSPNIQPEVHWEFQPMINRSRLYALVNGQTIDYIFQLAAMRNHANQTATIPAPPQNLIDQQRNHHQRMAPMDTVYITGLQHSPELDALYDKDSYAFVSKPSPKTYHFGYKVKG